MVQIRNTGPVLPPTPVAPPPTGAPAVQAPQAASERRIDVREASGRLMALRDASVAALQRGDGEAAARAIVEGQQLADAAAASTNDPQLKAAFLDAKKAFAEVEARAVQAAPPPAEPPADEKPPEKRNKGMFGFIGGLLDAAGSWIEKGARVVTFPLTLLGKGVDFIKEPLGKALGGLKSAIDDSIGQIPVIGQAVRFTTGLTASVVGIVDGLVTAVTHPVDTVKGLGSMLWTISGLVPGPKMLYDVAVHGKSPLESWQDSASGTLEVGKAMFAGAIEDVKAGNYAGALGRLTGDVGSLFLGGAGAARAAAWAGKYGRVGAIGAKAITTLGRVVTVDAKLMELGAAGAGKLAGRLAKLPAAERLAAKLGKAEKALAADAKALKGGGHVDDLARAERTVAQAPAHAPAGAKLAHADELLGPAARPQYAAPKYLENAKGRTFEQLALPQVDGTYKTFKNITLESVDGHVAFRTPEGMQYVNETGVDRLLYHPENVKLIESLRAPEPRALMAVHDQRFASLEIPRGDGTFTTIKDAKIAYADGNMVYLYDGSGQAWRLKADRMQRLIEHPGNAPLAQALEAKNAWRKPNVEIPDAVVNGVTLRPRAAGWHGTGLGKEIQVPTSFAGPAGTVDGAIKGISADGKLVVGAEITGPNAAAIAKELAPGEFFKHNPAAMTGYPWGTSKSGFELALGAFDEATQSFKTITRGPDGAWHEVNKVVALDDVMRNARPFTDLPMVKVTPDVRIIPYDDIGISVGEGSGFKISSRNDMYNVQRWYDGHMRTNASVFDALKSNQRFVDGVRNWHGLSEANKVELLKHAVEEYARQNGIPTPRFEIVDKFPDGRSGQFLPADRGVGRLNEAPGAIQLRRDLLKGNPADLLDTAIHEAAHGRQWHAIERFRLGKLDPSTAEHFFAAQFSDSWNKIGSAGADHYQGYRNNLIEQDAWSAGTDFGRRVAADPRFMPVKPTRVAPTLDWFKLKDPVRVPGTNSPGVLERFTGGHVQILEANGVRRVWQVEDLLAANPQLFNHLDFGVLPDGAPVKLAGYDPHTGHFGVWAFDQAHGQWIKAPHKFPLQDVLQASGVLEKLRW